MAVIPRLPSADDVIDDRGHKLRIEIIIRGGAKVDYVSGLGQKRRKLDGAAAGGDDPSSEREVRRARSGEERCDLSDISAHARGEFGWIVSALGDELCKRMGRIGHRPAS